MKDNIGIRLTLSSLLIDDDKTDEAATLLSPPKIPGIVLIKLLYATNWRIFQCFFMQLSLYFILLKVQV
jgi:hypothetical protein